MSVRPSAPEPPAALLEEAAGDDELDPQATNNIPTKTMTSRILIKEIIRLFI
jgi:hypothetical protein